MITGCLLRDAFISAAVTIANKKREVDELNVYPVPDGDTGTNMSLTFNSGAEQVEKLADDTSIGDIAKTLSKGLLCNTIAPLKTICLNILPLISFMLHPPSPLHGCSEHKHSQLQYQYLESFLVHI